MNVEDFEAQTKSKVDDILKSNIFSRNVNTKADEYMKILVEHIFKDSGSETIYQDDKVSGIKIENLKLDDPVFEKLLAFQVAIGTLTGNLIHGVSDYHIMMLMLAKNCIERFSDRVMTGLKDSMEKEIIIKETE